MGIILASQSPRRKELLELAEIEHRIVVSEVEELLDKDLDVAGQVQDLAIQKACKVAELYPQETIIGADTIVVLDGKILGKPKDEQDAFNTLKALSGRIHQVMTGVSIINKEKELITSFVNITEVEFYFVTDEWILNYISSGEPMDKAGSYGIQGKGFELVKSISGDYYSVMGLPIAQLKRTLTHLNLI
ncbi:nucleoside triphosphate pyrophosphatase [Turicibacter sp. TJ11]|uniref:Maf family protein n=1 Tax=Turicibacter sp. TJ11 TaxID=2806443 RepID=UPI001F4049BC|nr:Maf family protein [Turicibacter sp. TJ11]